MTTELRRISYDDDLITKQVYVRLADIERKRFEDLCLVSAEIYAGLSDDKLIAIWAFAPQSLLSDVAYVWSYTLPDVAGCKTKFLRVSREAIKHGLSKYTALVGVCDPTVGNTKWLKWLGAELQKPSNGLINFTIRATDG